MLGAADDFGTGLLQAILGVRDARTFLIDEIDARERVGATGDWQAVDEPVVVEAQHRVDVVHDRLARVQLLFGEGTETSNAAEAAVIELRAAVSNLGDWPISGPRASMGTCGDVDRTPSRLQPRRARCDQIAATPRAHRRVPCDCERRNREWCGDVNRARRVTLLVLALLVVGFVVTWLSIPNKDRRVGTLSIGYPARVFAAGMLTSTCVEFRLMPRDVCRRRENNMIRRSDIPALERRVIVLFGGAAAVVVLVGIAFGAARRE